MLKQATVVGHEEKNKVSQELKRLLEQNTSMLNGLEREQQKTSGYEREKTRMEREIRDLTKNIARLANERNAAITERDNTKRFLTAIEREFNWLKKKTEEEQTTILHLERDRNKLENDHVKQDQKQKLQTSKMAELKNLQLNADLANSELLTKVRTLSDLIGKQQVEIEGLNLKLRECNGRFLQMVEECKLKTGLTSELKR